MLTGLNQINDALESAVSHDIAPNGHGIEAIDVAYELSRERARGDVSPIAKVIEDAVKTASSFLVPAGLDAHL